ncbi:hypothetical protein PoB_003882300 [Plakobranchus ocellatus]|uniref:Uncharacterized protein n=1 Tax=Plakobranchus ocellatus TaxID=259542 RepID=A0AAV4AZN5_9GAST|nr:hypothetical protein PoB_003882300 [Plakobranchus ocellatus]
MRQQQQQMRQQQQQMRQQQQQMRQQQQQQQRQQQQQMRQQQQHPQQADLSTPSGQGTDGGARTRNRRVSGRILYPLCHRRRGEEVDGNVVNGINFESAVKDPEMRQKFDRNEITRLCQPQSSNL